MMSYIFHMYSPNYPHLAQLGFIPGQGNEAEWHCWMIHSVRRKRQTPDPLYLFDLTD